MSIESVMPSNHLILCRPLLLLPPLFPSIRVFSSESVFRIRWPKYWSFSFSISPSNEYSGVISLILQLVSVLKFCSPWNRRKSNVYLGRTCFLPFLYTKNTQVPSEVHLEPTCLDYKPSLNPYIGTRTQGLFLLSWLNGIARGIPSTRDQTCTPCSESTES